VEEPAPPRNPVRSGTHAVVSPFVAEAVAHRRRTTRSDQWSALVTTWKRPLVISVGVTVALRVITELVALVSVYGTSFPHIVARKPDVLIKVWNQWDTGYYLVIAQHGYPTAHAAGAVGGSLPRFIAFGPLYPALIWLAHAVLGTGLYATGQLVSAGAMVVAVAGLVYLTGLDGGPSQAGTAVMLLVAFPTAFFLLADYPDSLALACTVWAFIAARHRHWVLAGLVAAGAFMTKYYFAIAVVALLVEVWEARSGSSGQAVPRRRAFGWAVEVAVPTLAAGIAWMVFSAHRYGDALAFVHVQSLWGRHFAFPWTLAWTTAGDLVHLRFLDTGTASVMELFDAVTVVLLVVVAVYSFLRVRRSYGIMLGLAVCIFTFQSILYSETREVLALFPLFIGGARWVDGHPWRERAVLALSIPASYFLISRFVTGRFAG
jgi:hypothetical protein